MSRDNFTAHLVTLDKIAFSAKNATRKRNVSKVTRGNDVARCRGDDATSWRQHRDDATHRGVGDRRFRPSSVLISPQISFRRIIALLPFTASEIRGEKHAFTGVGSPKTAEQSEGPSSGTAMCRNTHRWTHREHGYGRTVGTDNTIDLRRLTALCCSSDSVVVASCANRSSLFHLPFRIDAEFNFHPFMLGNELFRAFTNKSDYASPR